MADEVASAVGAMQTPQPPMRDGQKMPPLGSFAPPASASKESKKRPRTEKQTPAPAPTIADTTASGSRAIQTVGNSNKRAKLTHKPLALEAPAIEPTLTPVYPEPFPAPPSAISNQDEIAFFDRVKKYLSNKSAMIEFLKLCNLFSQGIIDRYTCFQKGSVFIAASPELMAFWKRFLEIENQDELVDNHPTPPTGKVSLSNCRGYGPSYRLLPKLVSHGLCLIRHPRLPPIGLTCVSQERLKPCSGRDEFCSNVLNDSWASHPTWASEDSGFVAHRKNGFEEGLHRIEEERHDYDFNIEANLKCVQLLEPIAQSMIAMTDAEKDQFHMPVALAGQSTSIFKRVCKKIYGEKGIDVVNDLFINPFHVVPVVLARMKQKDEEWRFSQREWEKVWHLQTENMHLKSLDHMGIQVKSNDKKHLSAKHLVDVIKTKHEEQRRERSLKGKAPRYQFTWDFNDKDAIIDLLRIAAAYTVHNGQHSTNEKERIVNFFKDFLVAFFDLPEDEAQERIPSFHPDSGEDDADEHTPAELTNGRSKRNGKKGDLLRGVLDPGRNGTKSRSQKEDSAASGSKETTPEVGSANEEEMPDAAEDATMPDVTNDRWLPIVPKPTIGNGLTELVTDDGDLKADGFFSRPWYNFFCNQTIYVFFSVFQSLYSRLKDVKESTDGVSAEATRFFRDRPATEIGLTENVMNYFLPDDDPSTFWPKTLALIEEYIEGDLDEGRYQDILRHYYLKHGWKLYTIQDLLKSLCRLALTCTSTDAKEKTPELIAQYRVSREKEETSYQTEIVARKFAEKCVKDGELFVICWVSLFSPFSHLVWTEVCARKLTVVFEVPRQISSHGSLAAKGRDNVLHG
jgi:paired amphipathic helix protein Sin3a